jgi:hypothetical protein
MENSSDANFRKVTTNVTVKLAHSVVRIKTAEMQMYCVSVLQTKYSNNCGIPTVGRNGNETTSEFRAVER